MREEANLLYGDLTRKIIGAAMEVHREIEPGYNEKIYEKAFVIELGLQMIPYEQQKKVEISYKGHGVGDYVLDLLVDRKIVVELKAVDQVTDVYKAQLISYLKAFKCRVGLLINFAKPSLEWKRILLKEELLEQQG